MQSRPLILSRICPHLPLSAPVFLDSSHAQSTRHTHLSCLGFYTFCSPASNALLSSPTLSGMVSATNLALGFLPGGHPWSLLPQCQVPPLGVLTLAHSSPDTASLMVNCRVGVFICVPLQHAVPRGPDPRSVSCCTHRASTMLGLQQMFPEYLSKE